VAFVAEQADRPCAEPLHRKGEVGQPVMPRQRLARDAQRAHVERRRRIAIHRRRQQPAACAQHVHKTAARSVCVAVVDRQIFPAPSL